MKSFLIAVALSLATMAVIIMVAWLLYLISLAVGDVITAILLVVFVLLTLIYWCNVSYYLD